MSKIMSVLFFLTMLFTWSACDGGDPAPDPPKLECGSFEVAASFQATNNGGWATNGSVPGLEVRIGDGLNTVGSDAPVEIQGLGFNVSRVMRPGDIETATYTDTDGQDDMYRFTLDEIVITQGDHVQSLIDFTIEKLDCELR